MTYAFVCQGTRTPIGRYGGALSAVRTDDLAAHPLQALRAQFPNSDWELIDEVILGNTNQAGEDNRNLARMALLLADLPKSVPGVTVNRLCASGMAAVAMSAFSRTAEIYDTTIGWRFVNPAMEKKYGTIALGETAENVAERYRVDRESQDKFALLSQQRVAAAMKNGVLAQEISPVNIPGPKGSVKTVSEDEHPRPETTIEALAKLGAAFRKGGTVTAGNASGVNDGACAMFVASEEGARKFGLTPLARIVASQAAGVDPNYMGIGPIPAIEKLLARTGVSIQQVGVIELNEAFAAQSLACTRAFQLPDDSPVVNPNGGAIALGHPLGMSGARLILTASLQLGRAKQQYAIASMCIGVGQGMAVLLERV